MRSTSLVSRQSQIIAKIEINGSEAIRPPILGLRRATSETTITKMPDNTALVMRYIKNYLPSTGAAL